MGKQNHLGRYGPDEYGKASDRVNELGGDAPGVVHLVEVFDEEIVRNEREGTDMGPLYVVRDEDLDAFLEDHDGDASVQETCGITAEELAAMQENR